MKLIKTIAKKYGLSAKDLTFYGDYMAKIDTQNLPKKQGKLVLVTAMTSDKAGVGKTTITIGLTDALNKLGTLSVASLREASLGPVFGVKGGATGGGKATIEPSEEINLHFTGDFHAITSANNLLSAIIDNHIFQGNELNLDPKQILFKRCLDINDRSLRHINYNIGDEKISTGFNITPASEIMAILSLSKNIDDLKRRLGNILVALNKSGEPVYARDLGAENAMALLLKNAIKPNLVQTSGGNLAVVHCGPFANIAHGCASINATRSALALGDVCVTEAGFGSDLGGEKFIDIKTRELGISPNCTVLVITVKGTLEHGEGNLEQGFKNVKKHILNLQKVFNQKVVVAINRHSDDSPAHIKKLTELVSGLNTPVCTANAFTNGGAGCVDLAKLVLQNLENKPSPKYAYNLNDSINTKIEKLAIRVYGANSVSYSQIAEQKIKLAESLGAQNFYLCVAKTQLSISDNAKLLGAPTNYTFNITDIEIKTGARFVVAIAGNMLLMPGLAKTNKYQSM